MRYTLNCSILLTDLPVLERPAAAKAAGFDAIEFWWPWPVSVPGDAEIAAFEKAITDAGVQLTGLNFNAGDFAAGERGLLSWPARSQEFIDNIGVAAGIGERLGCTAFNALYGNRVEGSTPAKQDALGRENLILAAQEVAKFGGTILLEAASGVEAYPLKKTADVLTIIDSIRADTGIDNITQLADFYHLAVNGDDVDAVIAAHAAEFGHIQIADAPGRGEPGTGNLPIDTWLQASRAGGYLGYIGLEYKATGTDPFAWLPREKRGMARA
ncbi:MAG: TIM barrel protein [Microbacteriaceae bacterium]